MSEAPLLLDLFCGAGGAGTGYVRAGFRVVGVDIALQPRYPYEVHQEDALAVLEALLDGEEWHGRRLADFSAIHASPPCQGYSQTRYIWHEQAPEYPLLLAKTRERLMASGLPWVLENVPQAPMLHGLELCGTALGLRVRRHRLFDSSHYLFAPGPCRHRDGDIGVYGGLVTVLGSRAVAYVASSGRTHYRPQKLRLADGQRAMGIEWMRMAELCESIPPAYTEWIAGQLLPVVSVAA